MYPVLYVTKSTGTKTAKNGKKMMKLEEERTKPFQSNIRDK